MAPQAVEWRNRIVGVGEEDPEQLLANPRNFRMHPKSQQDALLGVLEEVGVVQDVLVNRVTGHLVDGHLRVTLALRTGQPAIPVKYIEVSEAEEALILATLDPIAAMAQADAQKLDELLREVSTESAAVQEMLAGLAESAGLYQDLPAAGGGGDDFDTTPEAGPTRTQLGDVWQCGAHRLVVGDSTDPATVARLMAGEQAALMVTDPPYGVEYDPTWRDEAGGQFGDGKTVMRGKVRNDSRVDWSDAYRLFDGDVVYIWHAGIYAGEVAANLAACDFGIRAQIVWVKQHFVLSRGAYHWQHEPCWYAVRRGKTSRWCGDRTQSTTWEIASLNPAGGNKSEAKIGHGTQKPIECMARPIRNHGGAGDIVYDPFGGSGSTLIACERTNRRARVIELEPVYADMIIRRYEAESGQEATLVERTAVQVGELQNA